MSDLGLFRKNKGKHFAADEPEPADISKPNEADEHLAGRAFKPAAQPPPEPPRLAPLPPRQSRFDDGGEAEEAEEAADPAPAPARKSGFWGRQSIDVDGPIPIHELEAHKQRHPRRVVTRILSALAKLALLGAVVGIIVYMAADAIPSGGGEPTGEPVTLYIKRGATAGDIARQLRKAGVIRSTMVFKAAAEYYGVSERLQAGEFHLYKGMKLDQVLRALGKGPNVPAARLTFPEGLTLRDMSEKLNEEALAGKVTLRPEEFDAAVGSTAPYVSKYPFLPQTPGASLEGYLFPDTYEVLQNVTAEKLADIMLSRFSEIRSQLDWKNPPLGLRPHQIVIVASLIEKEAKVDSERPLIAAVIYNRLKKQMPLQIDATIQYALPERRSRLSYEDLEVDSPYNTYKNKGIPPGPIANPGKSSLKAALKPAKVDYLYYVLKDSEGHHAFARTYQEFLRAKQKRFEP